MTELRAVYQLFLREILRFVRQRSRLVGALATPLMFWLVIGGGLGRSVTDSSPGAQPELGYLGYFFPGTIALSVLFTAIFSTISVIEDRHQGFLQGVLVSPVSRSAIVLSKILGGAVLGLMQGLILLLMAPVLGYALGLSQLLLIVLLLFLMASALTGLGFVFAWKIDSVQGYHGIMNMVLMPLWLLSGAVFPLVGSHWIFQWIAKVNPLTYAVAALRDLINYGDNFHPMNTVLGLVVMAAFCGVLYVISSKLVEKTV